MTFQSTAKLLVVLLVLCGAYWGLQKWGEEAENNKEAEKIIFKFEAADVAKITINPIDEDPTTAIQTTAGQWEIVVPDTGIRPSNVVWNRVAQNLAGLSNQRTLRETIPDLSVYGLEEPLLRIQAETKSGDTISLAFGDMDPTQSVRYACFEEGALFTITGDQFFELNRKRELLRHQFLVEDRDANLLHVEVAQIWNGVADAPENLDVAIGEESTPLTLIRDDAESLWKMVFPIEAAVDQEKAEALANEIRGGRGHDYIDSPEHLSDYGLVPARFKITYYDDATGEQQILMLGGRDERTGGVFAKHASRDAVFVIDPQIMTLIPTDPLQMRDKRMLTRPVGEAESIEYSYSGNHLYFSNKEGIGWQLEKPAIDELDQNALFVFITGLKAIEAAEFVDGSLEDYGLDNPLMSIRINHPDDRDSMLVLINRSGEDDVGLPLWYAVQQDSGDIMRINAAYAQSLIVNASDFRSPRLMRFSANDATRMEVLFKGKEYTFEKVHGQWLVREPEGAVLDNQSDAARILGLFAQLDAVAIEPRDSGDEVRYGTDEPVLSFSVVTQSEDEAEEIHYGPLRVGKLAGNLLTERYARMNGREGVFRVEQELLTTVDAVLRGVRLSAGVNN